MKLVVVRKLLIASHVARPQLYRHFELLSVNFRDHRHDQLLDQRE
jgi:hypothetical protein